MGTAKQLLPLGNGTVLERTLDNVRKSGSDEIILVLGSSADFICRQLHDFAVENIRIVRNPDYEKGMASSLRTGLGAVSPTMDGALIMLADQPFVRPGTLVRIIAEYRRTQAQIVIPIYQGSRGNPVLLDRSLFSEAMTLQGDVGCRAIFASHLDAILKVEVDDQGILLDIDSKEDYERLRHSEFLTESAD